MGGLPSLQQLALVVVSRHIEEYGEDGCLTLPFGCDQAVLTQLARSNRLRVDTLAPLLRSWSTAESIHDELGGTLAHGAMGSRGLGALAAQVLSHRAHARDGVSSARQDAVQREGSLPAGSWVGTPTALATAARHQLERGVDLVRPTVGEGLRFPSRCHKDVIRYIYLFSKLPS